MNEHKQLVPYRRATHDRLLALMSRLAAESTIHGTDHPNPLRGVPMDAHEGFVQSLFDAWAVVGDVLTFYQERILEEGFLRSARQPRSVRELARSVGYEPAPALSAQTTMAFTVGTGKGWPDQLTIPAGTPISASPAGGGPPPVFETASDLTARGEWNAIPLVLDPEPSYTLAGDAHEATVIGDDLGMLRAGTPLLISGTVHGGGPITIVATIASVEIDRVAGSALVRWTERSRDAQIPLGGSIDAPTFLAFRTATGLFGARAPEWRELPDATRSRYATRPGGVRARASGTDWQPYVTGAPDEDVIALAYDRGGAVVALTARRLMRWNGTTWTTLLQDARNGLRAFALAENAWYIGTVRGEVRVSRDGGTTWSDVGPALPTVLLTAARGEGATGTTMARLPAIAINALAVQVRANGAPIVYAGTDRGLAIAVDEGDPWQFRNKGLGGVGKDGQPCPVAIVSLALGSAGGKATLLAATSAGLSSTELETDGTPAGWMARAVNGAPATASFGSVAWGAHPYAAGSAGVFRADETRWAWTHLRGGAVVAAQGVAVLVDDPAGAAISADGGTTWTVVTGDPQVGAQAVALGPAGAAIALPLGAYPAEWPGFGLDAGVLDLDRMVPTLTDGWIVVADDAAPAPNVLAVHVHDVETVRRRAFLQAGLVSHLTVTTTGGASFAGFARRTTRVAFDGRPFRLAPKTTPALTPIEGTSVRIADAVSALPGGRAVVVSGRSIRARITGLAGGIRLLADDGTLGESALLGVDCYAIAVSSSGIRAAASPQGVWRRNAGAEETWVRWGLETLTVGEDGTPPVRALLATNDVLIAATTSGVLWRAWSDGDWSLAGGAVMLDALVIAADQQTLWGGGPDGMYSSSDIGRSWTRRPDAGMPTQVRTLAWDGALLIAGTTDGVFVRATNATWSRVVTGLDNRDVRTLAVGAGSWYAGTAGGGVYVSADRGASWKPLHLRVARDHADVRALAYVKGVLFVAVRGVGLARGDVPLDVGIANDVRAVVATDEGILVAARAGTVLGSQRFIPPTLALRDLGTVDVAFLTDLNQGIVPSALRLELKSLKIALPANPVVQTVAFERWLIVIDGSNDLLLRVAPDVQSIVVAAIASFAVSAAPLTQDRATQRWSVTLDDGSVGTFEAEEGDVLWAPAGSDDDVVAEVAVVGATSANAELRTFEVAFTSPLQRVYDGATVRVFGNVVAASHGESGPAYEVLGNGDAAAIDQEFTLRRPALTMLPDAHGMPQPQVGVVVRPTLPTSAIASAGSLRRTQAEAVGVRWTPVDDLEAAGPNDRVFTVVSGDDDRATVMFGDGIHGRRLPTGTENITAWYRVGNGPSGNLPVGAIALLRKRMAGVTGASNPVPASGGIAAADPRTLRDRVGVGLRAVGRIVSPADVADFARAFPGIEKAHVRWVTEGGRGVVHLTLAGPDGATVPPDGALAQDLRTAIAANGGARLRLVLHSYRARAVRIGAQLAIPSDLDAPPIVENARAALRDAFSFARRDLGEPIVAAGVIELLQAVRGVAGVTLTALYDASWSPLVAERIPADDGWATSDGECLLLLDPDPAQPVLSAVTT